MGGRCGATVKVPDSGCRSATARSAGHLLSLLCSECGLSPELTLAHVWFWPLDGDTVLGDGT